MESPLELYVTLPWNLMESPLEFNGVPPGI
jgi:hypothetical protein